MARGIEKVYEAGLELDLDDRLVVAHRLLASLDAECDDDQAEVDAAWRDEIALRVAEVMDGSVQLVSWEDTRAKARELLDAGRP